MARSPAHEHRWRIVAHTLQKPFIALLGCACSATMIPKTAPRQGEFEHLCCQAQKAA